MDALDPGLLMEAQMLTVAKGTFFISFDWFASYGLSWTKGIWPQLFMP